MPYLPTRVIDVGQQHDVQVRLVENIPGSTGPYIALSYCWGRTPAVTMETSNLHSMKQGIKLSVLPRTIQDAITVTRILGIQYIWIDALCIIQDSASDWEIESSRMASVYQNAYLTLAAATAAAGSEGFLHHDHLSADYPPSFKMNWCNEQGELTTLGFRQIPDGEIHEEIAFDPLSLRAWTLQERLLSRRVLTYSENELEWHCLTQKTCECQSMDKFGSSVYLASVMAIKEPKEAFLKWHQLLADYCTRAITFTQDRLPALSGIAKVIQENTGSGYIAGLWQDNLLVDLTWTVPSGKDEVCALPEYRAPTFSWASVESAISFRINPHKPWTPGVTIVGVKSEALGKNPLGRVRSAEMELRGCLFEASLVYSPGITKRYFALWNNKSIQFLADTRLEEFNTVRDDGQSIMSVRRSALGSIAQPAQTGPSIFLLYYGKTHQETGSVTTWNFLVLGRSTSKLGCFERLGWAFSDGFAGHAETAAQTTVTIL